MVCKNCGTLVKKGGAFCPQCGVPLNSSAERPSPQPAPAATKKKKRLIIGLIIGAALIGAAVSVYFLFFVTQVSGLWYSETGTVLELKDDGTALSHSVGGREKAVYEYNRYSGKGTLDGGALKGGFVAGRGVLTVETGSGNITFRRAGSDFDIDDYLMGFLVGVYSNEENAEVLELRPDMTAILHSAAGDAACEFHYNFIIGSGLITINGKSQIFTANGNSITYGSTGAYNKENSGFDIAGFIAKYKSPLIGEWYDTLGKMGTVTFNADRTFTLVSHGQTYEGTYSFSSGSINGTITMNGTTETVYLINGRIVLHAAYFTREFVAQDSSLYGDIEGKWYSLFGANGSIEFRSDGIAVYTENGTSLEADVGYDPYYTGGTLYIDSGKSINFYLSAGYLFTESGAQYGREGVS